MPGKDYWKNSGRASESLVSVLHLEIDVEGTDQNDNGSNGLHQVRYRSLV